MQTTAAPSLPRLLLAADRALILATEIPEQLWRRHRAFPVAHA